MLPFALALIGNPPAICLVPEVDHRGPLATTTPLGKVSSDRASVARALPPLLTLFPFQFAGTRTWTSDH